MYEIHEVSSFRSVNSGFYVGIFEGDGLGNLDWFKAPSFTETGEPTDKWIYGPFATPEAAAKWIKEDQLSKI